MSPPDLNVESEKQVALFKCEAEQKERAQDGEGKLYWCPRLSLWMWTRGSLFLTRTQLEVLQ